MRGWALTIVLAMGMAGAAGPSAAQGRWKQPNDLFSVTLPAGWTINEPERNRWTFRPLNDRALAARDAPAACILQLTESVSTMFRPQAELDRMMQTPQFLELWQRSNAELMATNEMQQITVERIHGLRFVHIVTHGRLRDPRTRRPAERGAVLLAMTLAPGQFWRVACGLPSENTESSVQAVNAILGTLRIHDTTGATNAR